MIRVFFKKIMKMFLYGVLAGLIAAPLPVAAQGSAGWQFKQGEGFVEAGICSAASSRSRYCVALSCQPGARQTSRWAITMPDSIYMAESLNATWSVDGTAVTFQMNRAGPNEDGIQFYAAYFDPDNPYTSMKEPGLAQSQALLQKLKRGNRLRISVDSFSSPQLSLRGSNAALSRLQAACPWTVAADVRAANTATQQFDDPYDAVLAMAARQNCIATESEIHDAYINAGGDTWTAGLIISGGAEDGSLVVVSRTPEFTYRIVKCTPR